MPRQAGAVYRVEYYDGRSKIVLDDRDAVEIPHKHMRAANQNTQAGDKSRKFICMKVRQVLKRKLQADPGWIDFNQLRFSKLRDI